MGPTGQEGSRYGIYDGIRDTYDGPLSMATDMMVWNLTRNGITERMAVSSDEAWDVKQRLDMTEVNKRWLDEYKKEQGLK